MILSVISPLPTISKASPVEIKPKKSYNIHVMTERDIEEEIKLGEMELLAQLVQAEAGNQDLIGKQYVADVVLNRVDDDQFPNTVEEVIFQERQFSVVRNGMFEQAAWDVTDEDFLAVELEWNRENRLDNGILYFNAGKHAVNGKNPWKYGDHWFGY